VRILLGLMLCVTLAPSLANKSAQSAPHAGRAGFKVTIISSQEVVRAGSDVKIQYSVTNTSAKQLVFSRVGDRDFTFHLEVRDSQGQELPPKKGSAERMMLEGDPDMPFGGSHRYYVDPGESVKAELIVTNTYDLNLPGKYTIQVWRTDDVTKAIVKSNIITVAMTQ
jgi:hypothetical protein